MHIDWTSFTPWASLAGGLLIGLATTIFLLGDGRIAGISGIVGGPLRAAVRGRFAEIDWTRVAFVAGLLVAPWLWRVFAAPVASRVDVSTAAMAAAGLLVGVGVRMGNGCTSGHGVCGISRFSVRSLANVVAFMVAGAASVFVMRHVLA
jgi:uncharacterized membrane protein YedE/YeeE